MSGELSCPECGAAVAIGSPVCGQCQLRLPRSFLSRSMTASSVLSHTFEVIGENFSTLFGLIVFVHLPWLVHAAVLLLAGRAAELTGETASMNALISSGLQMILGALSTAVLIFAVFQILRGREKSFEECLRGGAARLLPAVMVSIVVALLTWIGFLLLFVPGIIISLVLYVAVPVVVVERVGIGTAMSRSAALTKDRRLSILGLVILVALVSMIPALLGTVLGFAGAAFFGPGASVLATLLVGLIAGLINSVAVSVAYHDLRVDKEGIDTETLASVFD